MKRILAAVAVVVCLGGSIAFAATMGTTADKLTALTQSTTVPTIPSAPTEVSWYLQGGTAPGGGNGGTLVATAPTSGSSQAFEIATSPSGRVDNSNQSDNSKRRWFAIPTGTARTISGTAFVDLYATMKTPADFGKGGFVWAFLMDCPDSHTSTVATTNCTTFAYGSIGRKPWSNNSNPAAAQIQLLDWSTNSTTISRTIPATRQLVLFITVGGDAPGEDNMWVHWNSTGTPSRIRYTPGA